MRNNSIKIRRFKKSDAEAINRLLMRVFSKYNAKGVSQKGMEFFREKYSKENIQNEWGKDDYVLIIEEDTRLVGVGRAKKDGWISHLYVNRRPNEKRHRPGTDAKNGKLAQAQ